MNAHPLVLKFLMAALVVYGVVLFAATHVPLPPVEAVARSDKLIHWGAYALLAFLVVLSVGAARPLTWRLGVLLVLGLMAYAALDELLQIPIPGRQGDFWDWVADTAGILPGVGAALVVRPFLPRNARR